MPYFLDEFHGEFTSYKLMYGKNKNKILFTIHHYVCHRYNSVNNTINIFCTGLLYTLKNHTFFTGKFYVLKHIEKKTQTMFI